jgi:hypothetical protein
MANNWYCRVDGNVLGPFSATQLKDLVKQQWLKPDHEVAQQADGPWTPAARVRGLFSKPGKARAKSGTSAPGATSRPTERKNRGSASPWSEPVDHSSGDRPAPAGASPFSVIDDRPTTGRAKAVLNPAQQRRRQRKQLIVGAVVFMGVTVVVGGVLLIFNPFAPAPPQAASPPDKKAETDTTPASASADEAEVAEAADADDLGLFPDEETGATAPSEADTNDPAGNDTADAPDSRAMASTASAEGDDDAPTDPANASTAAREAGTESDEEGEVYQLDMVEKSLDQALGRGGPPQTEEDMSSLDKLKRDNPGLFE